MASAQREYLPAAAVSLGGLGLIAGLMLTPQPEAAVLGLVFPPWIDGGTALGHAAALSLPITDIRWHGRLVLIAPPATPEPPGGADWRDRLPPGVLVIAATGGLCTTPPVRTEGTPR